MSSSPADRNLLFGVLALQMDFITRDELIAGMNAWALEKTKPLSQVLVERGAMSDSHRTLLGALVDAHVDAHQGDPAQSLAALSSVSSVREALGATTDGDVQASLAHLQADRATAPDGEATVSFRGQATATGGRFRVLRFHDRGGIGEVFVARDEEVRREVALKQIQEKHVQDPHKRARFLIEAEITGGLEHPGIVPVYGLGAHDDGRPFYAMRFIRGDSLRTAIDRFHQDLAQHRDPGRRALELRALLGRFLDVCDAIAYAHSRGVLHRDLKPGNVMLGPYGETLVVDWGLAKAAGKRFDLAPSPTSESTLTPESGSEAPPTEMGQVMGTAAYMPPEQAAGRLDEMGPASDVYSLGATLYALLTGKAPYTQRSKEAIFRKLERGEFPPPRKLQPWVDPALEAVCLKAMALRPQDRYASPRDLAADLQRWLADEPVSAWREPITRRARRWARRHQTLVATATVTTLLLGAGGLYAAYQIGLRAQERRTVAEGRVAALRDATIRAVPRIIQELGDDRRLVLAQLQDMAQGDGPGRTAALLTLLSDAPHRAETLADRALEPETPPDEVLVIREALSAHDLLGPLRPRCDEALKDAGETLTDAQLRAAALAGPALAEQDAAKVATKLVAEDPLLLGAWREVFQPAAPSLRPKLQACYEDCTRPEARDRAFALLFEFAVQPDNPRGPEDLAALLVEAEPARMDRVLARLASPGDRQRALAFLAPRLSPLARFDEALAERQARVALARARLGEVQAVWPLLTHRDDPSVRTELIHEFAPYGLDAQLVIDRLRVEGDVSARRALVLALGEYPERGTGSRSTRSVPVPLSAKALVEELLRWYRADPDAGIHGAVDWLLRQRWGRGADLTAIDQELASPVPPQDRDWYVNGQGRTFTIVRGPVEFTMGSTPQSDPDRQQDMDAHRRRLPRSFAIATREVTRAEWTAFLKDGPEEAARVLDNPQFRQLYPTPEHAVGLVSWFAAAKFCNWLSQREGIAEDQWCYPKEIAPGMTLPEDFLTRTGYRLPTETEWEYANRAGAVAARPSGRSERRLESYAWFGANAERQVHAVGLLKPNDLGLFDTLGNVGEWCNDPHVPFTAPADREQAADEAYVNLPVTEQVNRLIRGATAESRGAFVRSANRSRQPPSNANTTMGLRVARTCP